MEAHTVMRINISNTNKTTKSLLNHLITLYAQEFGCAKPAVWAHLKSGDPKVGEYFVQWLRTQGWQVHWYNMPIPGREYLDDPHSDWLPVSFGLLFDPACDKLIEWRLSHT